MIFSDNCYLRDKCYKYQQAEECECRHSNIYCPKLFRVDYLYNEALLTPKQKNNISLRVDLDGTDRDSFIQLREIEKNIEQFVLNGCNLFIYSSICGNGKTEWSLKLLRAYIDKIWYKSDLKCKALFINVPRFLLSLKEAITSHNDYIDHIKKNILEADIVVFDEVATKSLTTFEHEHILSFINSRIDLNKSNVFTSNIYGQELLEKVGERLYSRIVNTSTNIQFFGKDKRALNK